MTAEDGEKGLCGLYPFETEVAFYVMATAFVCLLAGSCFPLIMSCDGVCVRHAEKRAKIKVIGKEKDVTVEMEDLAGEEVRVITESESHPFRKTVSALMAARREENRKEKALKNLEVIKKEAERFQQEVEKTKALKTSDLSETKAAEGTDEKEMAPEQEIPEITPPVVERLI